MSNAFQSLQSWCNGKLSESSLFYLSNLGRDTVPDTTLIKYAPRRKYSPEISINFYFNLKNSFMGHLRTDLFWTCNKLVVTWPIITKISDWQLRWSLIVKSQQLLYDKLLLCLYTYKLFHWKWCKSRQITQQQATNVGIGGIEVRVYNQWQ